jgi:hypothetical protein
LCGLIRGLFGADLARILARILGHAGVVRASGHRKRERE